MYDLLEFLRYLNFTAFVSDSCSFSGAKNHTAIAAKTGVAIYIYVDTAFLMSKKILSIFKHTCQPNQNSAFVT